MSKRVEHARRTGVLALQELRLAKVRAGHDGITAEAAAAATCWCRVLGGAPGAVRTEQTVRRVQANITQRLPQRQRGQPPPIRPRPAQQRQQQQKPHSPKPATPTPGAGGGRGAQGQPALADAVGQPAEGAAAVSRPAGCPAHAQRRPQLAEFVGCCRPTVLRAAAGAAGSRHASLGGTMASTSASKNMSCTGRSLATPVSSPAGLPMGLSALSKLETLSLAGVGCGL